MTKTAFFVQNNYVEHLTAPIARYANAHGISLEDRSSFKGFDPDDCGITWSDYDLVLPYGSVQFVRQLKDSSLAKFIFHEESLFATSKWSAIFGNDALNGLGCQTSVTEVIEHLRHGPRHLRPDMIDKAFSGGVFDTAKFENLRHERKLADDLACWISPLQTIKTEWRCWVVGGQIIEISKYRDAGQMSLEREMSPEVRLVSQGFADRYLPAPCVVLDVAMVNDQYKIIEFNPIHCCGWYKANIDVILDAWVAWSQAQLKSSMTAIRKLSF